MLDSKIARMVLQELMSKLDDVSRDGLKDSVMDHPEDPEMAQHTPEDMPDIMADVKQPDKNEPDEDDIHSIDPVVMLAKRFHK